MIPSQKIFQENKLSFIHLCNWIMDSEDYAYDNQAFEYSHFESILNEHYPNDGLSFNQLLNFFINSSVFIGFFPVTANGRWAARALHANESLICNDFNDWQDAQDKSIEYGFQVLNKILLLTKKTN